MTLKSCEKRSRESSTFTAAMAVATAMPAGISTSDIAAGAAVGPVRGANCRGHVTSMVSEMPIDDYIYNHCERQQVYVPLSPVRQFAAETKQQL